MRLLRFVFNLRAIYFKQTPLQILLLCVYAALILWLAGLLGKDYSGLPVQTLILAYIIVAYALMRTILRTLFVNKYLRQYPESVLTIPPADVSSASINLELDDVDNLKLLTAHNNEKAFLATFDFYQKTKFGDYLAKQAYYTVLEIPLQRKLPHILFDSKTAKKRQFRNIYLQAQRVSIQGTFDDVFDTYVPQTYNIDTLSFITPEVMETLVEAREYDIEIIDDRVLLYGPLLGKEDTEAFAAKGREIARQLNDNIDTYHDDRLKGEERKTNVTLFARSLLRSPRKYLIAACLTALVIFGGCLTAMAARPENRDDILFNQISVFIFFFFIVNAWRAVKIIRTNKKALEGYRILYQTDRGKPIKNSNA
jgi:hypothetical protein